MADTIAASSPVSWQHINLHGEYDFSDQPLPAEAPFAIDLIAAWQPPAKPGQGRVGFFPTCLTTPYFLSY